MVNLSAVLLTSLYNSHVVGICGTTKKICRNRRGTKPGWHVGILPCMPGSILLFGGLPPGHTAEERGTPPKIHLPKMDSLISSSMHQASFKCETTRSELKSLWCFLAIKRYQQTKSKKVIKQSRSLIYKLVHLRH